MKSTLHSALIYPLIFLFSYILKGKKLNYDDFLNPKKDEKKLTILTINDNNEMKEMFLFSKIKSFFDNESPLYDKTLINLYVKNSDIPEKKNLGIFNFSKKIDMYYSLSMLSKRITNDNLYFELNFQDSISKEEELTHYLRYCLLVFASRKIDKFFISYKNTTLSEKLISVNDTMKEYLANSKFENFTVSKDLYVLTLSKKSQKLDIIWTHGNREIELTDFNKVYDKFGILQKDNIKISQSPIYAFHK